MFHSPKQYVVLSCAILLTLCSTAGAQLPTVQRLQYSGVAPGGVASVTAYGAGLTNVEYLWTPGGHIAVKPVDDNKKGTLAQFEGSVPESLVPGICETRLVTAQGVSLRQYLVVDDLPTFALPDAADVNPPKIVIPDACSVNGFVAALKPKYFGLRLGKDQEVSVEVFARRIDSILDPVLRVMDPAGKELAFADDTPGLSGDAQLKVVAPTEGTYTLELRDVKYSGGGGHFFHLRVGPFALIQGAYPRRNAAGSEVTLVGNQADPANAAVTTAAGVLEGSAAAVSEHSSSFATVSRLSAAPLLEVEPNDSRESATPVVADAAAIAGRLQQTGDSDWYQLSTDAKQHLCIATHTRTVGAPTDVVLRIYDEAGKQLQESDDAGIDDARLSLALPAAGTYFLKVQELTGQGGAAWTYDLDLQWGGSVKAETTADSVSLPKGGTATVPVAIERFGVGGVLEVVAENLPAGVTAAPVFVPANQKTAIVAFQSTPEAADRFQQRIDLHVKTDSAGIQSPVLYVSAAAKDKKKADHRMRRLQAGLFSYPSAAAAYSLNADPGVVTVAKGASASVTVIASRTGDWKQEIELSSAVPAAELPAGVIIDGAKITDDKAVVTIKATDKANVGRYSISLQGTLKKDKKTIVQPVPTITVDVTEAAAATAENSVTSTD